MNGISDFVKTIETTPGLISKLITVARNEYIITPGTIEKHIYLVESGALRVFYVSEFEEHTIRFGYKDSFITSLGSFISGQPSEFFIQALKKSRLKLIRKQDYLQFVRSSPQMLGLYQAVLEEFVLQQMEREIDILTESPTERYNRVLKRSPQLFQEIPSKYIASYLRMTPETLSRLKKS